MFSVWSNTSASRWWRAPTTCPAPTRTAWPRWGCLNLLCRLNTMNIFQGVLTQSQMEALTDKQLMEKHRTFRLNTGEFIYFRALLSIIDAPDTRGHTFIISQWRGLKCRARASPVSWLYINFINPLPTRRRQNETWCISQWPMIDKLIRGASC